MQNKKVILLAMGVVVLMGVVCGSSGTASEKTELTKGILNPSFEILDKSGKPESWTEDRLGGWSLDQGDPHDGKVSMQATVSWSWLSQEIAVKAERSYELKVYARSNITVEEKDYQNTFLTLEFLNRWGKVIKQDYGVTNATSSWRLKQRWILTPPTTKKIRIKLAKRKGEGSVWFDDVSLRELPADMVLNPGFEQLDSSQNLLFWSAGEGWSLERENPHGGKICLKATKSWSWLSQEVLIKPWRNYVLRVYLRSDVVLWEKEKGNTFLAVECLDKNGQFIKKDHGIVDATFSWQPKENWFFAPRGAKKIRIKLAKRLGIGSVWFDDIKLIRKPLYLNFAFVRRVLQDKAFFIFYFLVYALLLFSLLRIVLAPKRASRT